MKKTIIKLKKKEVFDTWLHGTSKDILWELAKKNNDKALKKEIVKDFRIFLHQYGNHFLFFMVLINF